MKQFLVISGKGGTGKTVVTGAFAALAKNKVMVDCDVDAADLHLLLHPTVRQSHEFRSGRTAAIDPGLCTKCGRCVALCQYGAIRPEDPAVEPFSCEGCGICARVCPEGAIRMDENIAGEWFVSDTAYGPFVHARLGTAQENSGKLVARIRQAAKELAEEQALDCVIVDGPPGIGCPVIASLSGIDLALVVTEPTLSGLHDAERAVQVARHFNTPVKLVINKYDLDPGVTAKIEAACTGWRVPVIGKIAFDKAVVDSMVKGIPIVEHVRGAVREELAVIWDRLRNGNI